MCVNRGGDGGAAERARKEEEERKQRIADGTVRVNEAFAGFDDNFYNKIRTDYTNYYIPQLEDQYGDAVDKTTFALADRGQLNSTVANDKFAELAKLFARQKTSVGDRALSASDTARADVDRNKSQLIAQLEGGAGIDSTAAQAASIAQMQSRPQTYDPIANVFQTAMATLSNGYIAEQNGYQGLNGNATSFFNSINGSRGGSSRVVN